MQDSKPEIQKRVGRFNAASAHPHWGPGASTSEFPAAITKPPRVSTMDANSPPQKSQTRVISPLGTAIEVANLTKLVSGMTPTAAACFCVIILLTLIRVRLLFSIDSLLLHVERI